MEGADILEIAKRDPAEAHRLVARALGERGHKPWFEFRGRQECIRKASSKPLPGASEKAFTKGAIEVAGEFIRQVVPTHFAVLQSLKSPLLAMMENATAEKKTDSDFDDEQQWEACYVFTAEPKALRRTLKGPGGIDIIKKNAEEACGDWSAAKLNFVMLAIIEQLKRHIETTVKFAAEMEEKNDVSFFRDQTPPPVKPAGLVS